jgi:hypothetical protein
MPVKGKNINLHEEPEKECKKSTFPDLSKIWGYRFRAKVGVRAVRRALEKCTPHSGTGVFTS